MELHFDKEKAVTLIVSAEKIMYGVVMLRLDQIDEGVGVRYLAIADGGDVCGDKEEIIEGKSILPIMQSLAELEYADDEDDEMSVAWGLQLGDDDSNLLCKIGQGLWDTSIIMDIIECIEKEIGSCEAIDALRDLIEF